MPVSNGSIDEGVAVMERRQDRRVLCQATLLIQRKDDNTTQFKEQVTADVSLGGVLFQSNEVYKEGEELIVSVAIPQQYRQQFPFTRLAGRARVARVRENKSGPHKYEVALAFSRDVTTLMAVPTQS